MVVMTLTMVPTTVLANANPGAGPAHPPVWTGPVILTLCIAALAFVMSGVALGWQIYSWRRSGPQVTVVRMQGIGPTPAWTGPGADPGTWFIGVEARNSGRLGTEVQQFGFALPNGETITAIQDVYGGPVNYPYALPPGGKASVMYDPRQVQSALAGRNAKKARPFATTGHGRFEGEVIDLDYDVDLLCRQV
jgi:hypothetical protein